jgi:hypothetical protein
VLSLNSSFIGITKQAAQKLPFIFGIFVSGLPAWFIRPIESIPLKLLAFLALNYLVFRILVVPTRKFGNTFFYTFSTLLFVFLFYKSFADESNDIHKATFTALFIPLFAYGAFIQLKSKHKKL